MNKTTQIEKEQCGLCGEFYLASGTNEDVMTHMRQSHGIPL